MPLGRCMIATWSGFTPTPPGDHFWYGDESLWTALPPDGVWDTLPRNPGGYTQKLLWWRVGYSWTGEPEPDLQVTAHRLDDPAIAFSESPATNAFAPDIQSAILIGVEFPTPGCWQITGRYADAELSYVVQIEPGEAAAFRAPATTASSPPDATPTPAAQVTPTSLTPSPPTAIPTPVATTTLQLVGHLGGRVSAIAPQGETLYSLFCFDKDIEQDYTFQLLLMSKRRR